MLTRSRSWKHPLADKVADIETQAMLAARPSRWLWAFLVLQVAFDIVVVIYGN